MDPAFGLMDTTQLVIGEETQYFFDDGIIEFVSGLTRAFHSPKKLTINPLIGRNQPWEQITYFACNSWAVWRDESSGRFNCVYTDWHLDRDRFAKQGGSVVDWNNARLRQLYAFSDDGVTWVKPALDLVIEGGANTNILFGSEDFGSSLYITPFQDLLESDPLRRYKSLYTHIPAHPASPPYNVRVGIC